ncbi:MAG TPA: VOC family protein [Myxococcota bacterium]|nr:VOC family protein [Myxococcota bacterium]
MGFHHLAVATRDAVANDVFYEKVMGFRLTKVEVGSTPSGWAKHLFYDTGSEGMIAFWELHDDEIGSDYPTALSEGVGLPIWVNHIAFHARDLTEIESRRQRWLDAGYDVMEIDHHWCYSIYTQDPNGTLVEFCTTTAEFGDADRKRARELLTEANPTPVAPKSQKFHKAMREPLHLSAAKG